MSGCGVIAADPAAVGLSVRTETIVAERAGVLAFAREHGRQVDLLIERGRLTAAEATTLKARVRAFADGVAQGLHVAGDEAEVRRAMRDVVLADQAERAHG